MIQVLVVDDEPLVLRSLSARIRREPGIIGYFVGSVQEALPILENEVIDVVLTDMRMPERDGCSLLREVRGRWPDAVRMVMSGHLDRQASFEAGPLAHLLLSKPCTWESLQDQLHRAAAVRTLIREATTDGALERLEALPAVNTLHARLGELAQDPRVGLAQLADVVAEDPAIAARVLQVANSAWLGLNRQVASLRDALAMLGTDLVRKITLSAELFEKLGRRAVKAGVNVGAVQQRSLLTSRIASRLVDREAAPVASTAGLLHEAGTLALAAADPDGWRHSRHLARQPGVLALEAEREVFGCNHATAGALLLNRWGLPLPIVEAAAFHHGPIRLPSDGYGVAGAVHLASHLAACASRPSGLPATLPSKGLDPAFADAINFVGEAPRLRRVVLEAMGIERPGPAHPLS